MVVLRPDRRELGVAVLLCLLGSLMVLVAAGRGWAEVVVVADALRPAREVEVAGTDLAPGVRALGLVGLAGVVALAATRGRGRAVVGVVLAAAGAGVVVEVVRALADLDARALLADAARQAGASGSAGSTAWPVLCVLGAVLVVAAGVLVTARGRRWAALSSRYEPPLPADDAGAGGPAGPTGTGTPLADAGTPVTDTPVADAALWADLDRGVDPTR